MESISISKKRLRNRRKRRQVRKNKRLNREGLRFEVKTKERQKLIAAASAYLSKNKQIEKSMEAKAFWENYTTAQAWQQKHNVVWWKSRCVALEAENVTLRETIRKLVQTMQCQNAEQINNIFQSAFSNYETQQTSTKIQSQYENDNIQKQENQKNYQNNQDELNEDENHSDDENFEFQVNEGMMDFLKQSIKHKMELKEQREKEEALERDEEIFPQMKVISLKEKIENAKLLYGEASPRILGMETALQATIDSHKDKTRPNYWPNIPLKL